METSDGFLLSIRRSQGVGEGQGMLDCPGGHPEPEVSSPEGLRSGIDLFEGVTGGGRGTGQNS